MIRQHHLNADLSVWYWIYRGRWYGPYASKGSAVRRQRKGVPKGRRV